MTVRKFIPPMYLPTIVALGFLTGCGQKNDLVYPAPSASRVNRLCEAIDQDEMPRHRIIEELGIASPGNAKARKVLLAHLFNPSSQHYTLVMAKALSRNAKLKVPEVVAAFSTAGGAADDERLAALLILLGKMGPAAQEAIPFLQELLKERASDEWAAASLRVVLANVGSDSPEITGWLRREIANRTEGGKMAVRMLADVTPGPWFDNRLAADLSGNLGKHAEDDIAEMMVLARCGERARSAVGLMRARLRMAEDGEPSRDAIVQYAFNLWLAAPSDNASLRMALKYIGGVNAGREHPSSGEFGRFLGDLVQVLNEERTGDILRALDDNDPEIVDGAMILLPDIGLPDGYPSTKRLTRVLETHPNEKLRASAARALGTVAHPSIVSRLEADLKKEKSETVQRIIREAIMCLRLENEETSQDR